MALLSCEHVLPKQAFVSCGWSRKQMALQQGPKMKIRIFCRWLSCSIAIALQELSRHRKLQESAMAPLKDKAAATLICFDLWPLSRTPVSCPSGNNSEHGTLPLCSTVWKTCGVRLQYSISRVHQLPDLSFSAHATDALLGTRVLRPQKLTAVRHMVLCFLSVSHGDDHRNACPHFTCVSLL